jgi:phosphoadenosine phosphosulfate reductase
MKTLLVHGDDGRIGAPGRPTPTAAAQTEADRLSSLITALDEDLRAIARDHRRPALASSLSAEDMVITDAIARLGLPIDVFTLDTGRLHTETVALIEETRARFGVALEVMEPNAQAVAAYVAEHGRDGFYEGVPQRKACCHVRKVEPLSRALAGRDAWITGQRRDQAVTRTALEAREHDAERGMTKYNPLAAWNWRDVLAYAAQFSVPMNALYQKGYVSIGCEPCTKATRPGEDPRAGRWWWENQDSKECGLHT